MAVEAGDCQGGFGATARNYMEAPEPSSCDPHGFLANGWGCGHNEGTVSTVIQPVSGLFGFFQQAIMRVCEKRKSGTSVPAVDYLAQLLVRATPLHRSLVLTLDEALACGSDAQFDALRGVGDAALYAVGFFPGHLEREGVDAGLYVRVGSFAYERATRVARGEQCERAAVLDELRENFGTYADLLGEIAESAALGAVTRDLVRLYDRWKVLGSERALEAMARAGVFPSRGGGDEC